MMERVVSDMGKTVKLLINHYISDDFNPSRQTTFMITKECLQDYLIETEDDRTIEEFVETYDSNESEVVYDYASDDGRILSEEITYCDDFIERYNAFIAHTQMFNPDMAADQISTKENYYWIVYAQ